MMDTPKGLIELALGERYPDDLYKLIPANAEGAITEFLRPMGNTLIICISDIEPYEAKAMRNADLYGGILVDYDKINFIWQFRRNKKPVLTFEGMFDSTLIPDLTLPDMDDSAHYLVFHIHAIDKTTRIIKAIRSLTIPRR